MNRISSAFLILSVCFCTVVTTGWALDFNSYATRGYEGKGELEFIMPEDLLLGPKGELIVADHKNNRIQVLRSDGLFERFITIKEPVPSAVEAAVAKAAKKAAQDDEDQGEVKKKDKRMSAAAIVATETTRLDKPVGLALDGSGNLYVSSSGNSIILVFNFKSGALLRTIGRPGRAQGELNTPMDLDVSSDGTLAVADFGNKRVQLFETSGKFLKEIHYKEETPKKELRSLAPRGVCWLSRGELAVSYPTFNQVVCWENNGSPIWRYGSLGSGKGELKEPSYLTMGSAGNVLIADSGNNRIVEVTPTGLFAKHHSSRGTMAGKLLSPRGLVFLPKDDCLLVADQGNNRVQYFRPGKADLIMREAKALIEKDQWDDALPKIEQVINLDPNSSDARALMVNSLHFFGDRSYKNFDFEKAEEFYRRVLLYNPNDLEVQPKLNDIFWAANKDLILRVIFGIIGVVAALILIWVMKITFNRMIFGHA